MSAEADDDPVLTDRGWRLRASLRGIATAAVIYAVYALIFGPGPEKSFPAGIAAALILFSLWYAIDAWRADRPEEIGMPRGERERSGARDADDAEDAETEIDAEPTG